MHESYGRNRRSTGDLPIQSADGGELAVVFHQEPAIGESEAEIVKLVSPPGNAQNGVGDRRTLANVHRAGDGDVGAFGLLLLLRGGGNRRGRSAGLPTAPHRRANRDVRGRVMVLIEKDVTGEKILAAGQVLGIGQSHEASLCENTFHVAAGANTHILQRLDAVDKARGLDVGRNAGGAILFTGDGDPARIVSGGLELCPVGIPLILIVADQVVQCRLNAQLSDREGNGLIEEAENDRPRPVIPGLQLPLVAGLIAGLAARVSVVLVFSAV